jgi:hypothetical protein
MEQITTTTTSSQEVSPEERINSEIKKFNLADAAIAELKAKYSSLAIVDANDKEGYKKVSEGRKEVKKARNAVENKRKELVEDSVKLQKAVNGEAARLKNLLLEIEAPFRRKRRVV